MKESVADHFQRAMSDVTRLAPDPRGRVRAPRPVAGARPATKPASSSGGRHGGDDDDDLDVGFVASGVDRRELRKLKRGEFAPGARLDLHGQTAADAVAGTKQFIDGARHRHRCVSIVHGRGLHSKDNVSILKTRVRRCLKEHTAVLAFADAPRNDGGPGAVYVLLRK